MKILIANGCGMSAHYYSDLGISRAFAACGHEAYIWDINKKSAFDIFDELNPDIFIGQTYNITDALIACLEERPYLKICMKAGDWGYNTEEISSKYPVLVANEKEKHYTQLLKQKIGKPDFLFIHHHPASILNTHGYWMDNDFKVFSLMNAADIFDYTNGVFNKKYESDIGMVGGYWPYKAKVLDKWLLPLCSNFNYNIKIFGNGSWPVPQYYGFIDNSEVKNFLKSCKICVNLHEPHSHEFGYDIVERPFKILSNKCFCISDYVSGLSDFKGLILCKTPEEFKNKIDYFLDKPKEREEIANIGFQEVLEKHTYFDRISEIFKYLELDLESENVLKTKKDIFRKLEL